MSMITTIITTSIMSMNSCKTKGVWGGEACFKSKPHFNSEGV